MPPPVFRRPRLPCVLAGGLLLLVAGRQGWAAPPFHGSLFTPVEKKTAIGPPAADPLPYYPYEPRTLDAWTDVASDVREKVAAHLKARLGEAFYGRLKFAGGEAVNVDELHREVPASRKFAREVPTYLLWFEFEQPEVGIRVYTASVELRRDGSVLREIDLPPFAAEPGKLKFCPLAEVTERLAARGMVDPKTDTVNLAYDPQRAQIVWHFERALPGKSAVVSVRNIDVNANTGAVLRRWTNRGGG